MSLSAPKNNINNLNLTQRTHRFSRKNPKLLAIEDCKKLYQKYYAYPSTNLLNQLNENHLTLFLDKLNYKDIAVIKELLMKYFYFQKIEIFPTDPNKPDPTTTRRCRPPPLTESEKYQLERNKKYTELNIKHMIYKLIISVSKHISTSNSLTTLSINGIELNAKYCEYLSKGVLNNKQLESLSITNSKMPLNSYELLIECLLNHTLLSYLDLSNNNFGDKYGKIISRLIIRQFQRRDQIIWSYGLRNEIPLNHDYRKGLISINLNGNNLGIDSAECISSALYSDQYIRAVFLNNNKMDTSSCKKFIYMMRKNLSILTIDLRGNPGYDVSIHSRLVMKMSKNIRYLYQQYKKGEYTEEEFENFKFFIDVSFFDVDIPQTVVEFYNSHLPENTDENENKDIYNESKNIKTDIENNKVINDKKQEKEKEENDINHKINDISKNEIEINPNKSMSILEENKKLYDENIKLKKQIIELKAKNLRRLLSREGEENNNNENRESKESNSSDIDKDYHKVENLINELNELVNKIEKKKSKKKEKNKEDNKFINNNNKKKDNIIEKEEKDNKKYNKEIVSDEIELKKEKEIITSTDNKNKINSDLKENKNNINTNNMNNNNVINKKEENNNDGNKKDEMVSTYQQMNVEPTEEKDKKEESSDTHFIDENGNVFNIDDLTEEEKMIIIQQQLILQKLQEEAEARGEQFDPHEYIEFLEKQAKEEEEKDIKNDGKLNKSF